MSDTHMVSKIAWMIHSECMEWIESEDDYKKAARKLIEIVRKHDARLTKRALDGRKRGAKSKSLNGKGGSKAARQ